MSADLDALRAALRVATERISALESRLSEHDRQIATLDDAARQHEIAIMAFGLALAEVSAIREELDRVRDDVAGELAP